jgi:hypothetical protein
MRAKRREKGIFMSCDRKRIKKKKQKKGGEKRKKGGPAKGKGMKNMMRCTRFI